MLVIGLQVLYCRDECRFPHVMPDGHIVGRASRFRSPPQNALNGNGHANLEEKLANLTITEVSRFMACPVRCSFSRDTFSQL